MSQGVGLHSCSQRESENARKWNRWAEHHHIAVEVHHMNNRHGARNEQCVHLFLTAERTGSIQGWVRTHGGRTDTGDTPPLVAKAKDANQRFWDHRSTRDSPSTGDTDRRLANRCHISGRESADPVGVVKPGGRTDHFSDTTRSSI